MVTPKNKVSNSRIIKLVLVAVALIAAGLAVSVPAASAQTVSGVPRICANGGVIVLNQTLGGLRCAVAADAPTPGQTSRCPAGSDTATELGIEGSTFIGSGANFIEGACYYDTTCPAGYTEQALAAQGPSFVWQYCVPSDPSYQPVLSAENCVASDGVTPQWFPESGSCKVVTTPPVLEPGVSSALEDCTAIGASYDTVAGVCGYRVYSNGLTPEPTVDPPVTPTPVVDPPAPTATPIVDPPAPTATPVAPVATATMVPQATATMVPQATATAAPATATPTPKHPGFGFTG